MTPVPDLPWPRDLFSHAFMAQPLQQQQKQMRTKHWRLLRVRLLTGTRAPGHTDRAFRAGLRQGRALLRQRRPKSRFNKGRMGQ
jgi:hypothetical protein